MLAVRSAWPSPGLDACLGGTTAIFKPNGPSLSARAALAAASPAAELQRRSYRVGGRSANLNCHSRMGSGTVKNCPDIVYMLFKLYFNKPRLFLTIHELSCLLLNKERAA